jgi:hypothetical protein
VGLSSSVIADDPEIPAQRLAAELATAGSRTGMKGVVLDCAAVGPAAPGPYILNLKSRIRNYATYIHNRIYKL